MGEFMIFSYSMDMCQMACWACLARTDFWGEGYSFLPQADMKTPFRLYSCAIIHGPDSSLRLNHTENIHGWLHDCHDS